MTIGTDMMVVPWLEKLMAITTFFTACEVHQNEAKNECNKFCLDCNGNPLCGSCTESHHKDHRVIQIRRSSYNNVVKTTEIYKHLDILGVQTYVISNFTVVFINKRAYLQPKRMKVGKIAYASDSLCKTCDRNLVDFTYFCSLACKFAYIKENGGFSLNEEEMEEMKRLLEKSIKVLTPKEKAKKSRELNLKRKLEEAEVDGENEEKAEEEGGGGEREDDGDKESMLPVNRSNSRRKGIPQRAPFF